MKTLRKHPRRKPFPKNVRFVQIVSVFMLIAWAAMTQRPIKIASEDDVLKSSEFAYLCQSHGTLKSLSSTNSTENLYRYTCSDSSSGYVSKSAVLNYRVYGYAFTQTIFAESAE